MNFLDLISWRNIFSLIVIFFGLGEDLDKLAFSYFDIQEHIIKTAHAYVSVAVFGDQDKPALITYPDLALNCKKTKLNSHKLYHWFSTKFLRSSKHFS